MKPPEQTLQAIITDDPLGAYPIGAKAEFSSTLFAMNVKDELRELSNWNIFLGAVLALHFGDQHNQRVIGSGVLIAPGLAITAWHILEGELPDVLNGGGFICSAIGDAGMMVWRPTAVARVSDSDVALISLKAASDAPALFHNAVITTRTPRLGERLIVAGFRSETFDPSARPIPIRILASAGAVSQQYETGRDRVMLPGPCIEVDCSTIGGMSGGPVFDENGFLIGILSSSIDGGPSYVSLIWMALCTPVSIQWPAGLHKGRRRSCS